MKIGLVGYKGSGKSTLFEWFSGVKADPALSHSSQSAMASIPEPRLDDLIKIYNPKKVTYAAMEILDTPGLSRDQEGNVALLGHLRQADYLVCVVPVFDGSDVQKEIDAFLEDMVLADLEIALNRIDKIKEQQRRPLSKDDQQKLAVELEILEKIKTGLENGHPVLARDMSEDEYKATRSFRFLTEKNRMILVNTGDDETDHAKYARYATPDVPVLAVSVGLEMELAKMEPQERDEFLTEMGLHSTDRGQLLRTLLDNSGQMVFLTGGDKEVRSWLMRKNGTALEAAGSIHTDFIKKFIRAEVIKCDDLVRLGSEREVKAAGLNRREHKDYIVQEGDVILFHISQ
ncbi:MAG: DUF933 domain-containing protein [Thermoguttaceae bacterium]|nr:DUF933 domain-containing protein [Thermoguttaceae bacterium]